MDQPLVTIQLVVWNSERYIRHCLRAVKMQTYPHCEVIIWDNASTDRTHDIIRTEFPEYPLIEHSTNIGMWPAHERILERSRGTYIVVLSADVIIDPYFVEHAVAAAERDLGIGAIQAKVYRYDHAQLTDSSYTTNRTIDTCGFAMTRGRKVLNIGHGQEDRGQFSREREIFGVEGAVPFFRRIALEDVRIQGHIVDPDYFWYGDDLDLAWRTTLMGHRQMFVPNVIAWHDRSTTKDVENTGFLAYHVRRRKLRQRMPIIKRRLDWSNTRFTIIKNDHARNILRDIFPIIMREINVQGYAGLFEPAVLLEWGRFLRLLPRMLVRRRIVMARARCSADHVRTLMLMDAHEQGQKPRSEWLWHLLRASVVCIVFGLLLWAIFFVVSRFTRIF